MTLRRAMTIGVLGLLLAPAALLARQSILKNGSMEFGEGAGAIDPQVADQWTEFGINVERSPTVNYYPPDGGYALKAFGDGDSTASGANQVIAGVSAGQIVSASVQLHTPSFDKLGGSGQAGLVLEFLDMFGGTISLYQVYPLNAASPGSTWIPAALGPYTAPAGTVKVRVACRLTWTPGDISGAAYWDDVIVLVNGTDLVLNGDFETAGHSTGQSSMGIDDWIGFNDQEKSADVANDGLASLKLGTREAYSGLFQNMKTLQEGDRVYLQAYVWNPQTDPLVENSRAGLKLEFSAGGGSAPPPVENLAFDETATADQWTLVDLSTTVPEDVSIAKIVCIYVGDAQTIGDVHFDWAYAELGTAPGVNQLLNPSFEDGLGGPNGIADWTEFYTTGVSSARKSCFTVPAYDEICTMKATGQAVAGIFQEIAVTPGETLDVSAYLYTPSTAKLTGPGLAGVKVEWVLGTVPPPVDIGPASNTINASAPKNTWIRLYIDYTMPAGTNATTRFVDIIEKGTALSGRVYFDACEAVVLNRFDGADADGDDDEDLHDFAQMQIAYTGSGGPMKWNGMVFDSTGDNDVDFADFQYFAPHMTGPLP